MHLRLIDCENRDCVQSALNFPNGETAMPRGRKSVKAQQPSDRVITNLILRKALRDRLQTEADAHQNSLSREMVSRLEQSLELGPKKSLADLTASLNETWDNLLSTLLLFKGRVLMREHTESVLAAVEAGDLEAARTHLMMLRRMQASDIHKQVTRLQGNAPSITVSPTKKE
jgi:hypothetical protein